MTQRKRRTFSALFVLVVIIVGLHFAARAGLRGPTGRSMDELNAWAEDPVEVAATVARWVALGLAYYLLVVVAAIGLFTGEDEDAPTGIRRLIPSGLATAVGLALGIGVPLASGVLHAAGTDAPAPTAQPASLRLEVIEEPLVLRGEDTTVVPASEPRHHLTPTFVDAPEADTWRVEQGESFWSIAHETMQDHGEPGDELDDETIAAYWRVLIDANVDRLIEPGNPDLIMPGQEFVLPPISRGVTG